MQPHLQTFIGISQLSDEGQQKRIKQNYVNPKKGGRAPNLQIVSALHRTFLKGGTKEEVSRQLATTGHEKFRQRNVEIYECIVDRFWFAGLNFISPPKFPILESPNREFGIQYFPAFTWQDGKVRNPVALYNAPSHPLTPYYSDIMLHALHIMIERSQIKHCVPHIYDAATETLISTFHDLSNLQHELQRMEMSWLKVRGSLAANEYVKPYEPMLPFDG